MIDHALLEKVAREYIDIIEYRIQRGREVDGRWFMMYHDFQEALGLRKPYEIPSE